MHIKPAAVWADLQGWIASNDQPEDVRRTSCEVGGSNSHGSRHRRCLMGGGVPQHTIQLPPVGPLRRSSSRLQLRHLLMRVKMMG